VRLRPVALFAGLFLAGTAGLGAQGGAAATDSARIQGTWTMISGSADGVPMPPATLKAMKRQADGPYVTITMGGQVYFKAHFVLKPGASPKEIDYHMLEGFTKGATQLGVYRVSGDTAWFCFGAPGAARATDFTSVAGDKRTLSVWVHTK
jgi:uncharacterized protein (TIGR03067 family)